MGFYIGSEWQLLVLVPGLSSMWRCEVRIPTSLQREERSSQALQRERDGVVKLELCCESFALILI